jgi:hypothetical protein
MEAFLTRRHVTPKSQNVGGSQTRTDLSRRSPRLAVIFNEGGLAKAEANGISRASMDPDENPGAFLEVPIIVESGAGQVGPKKSTLSAVGLRRCILSNKNIVDLL